MGDKSPKSRERKNKQDTLQKEQKKADAFAKANPAPPVLPRKGK